MTTIDEMLREAEEEVRTETTAVSDYGTPIYLTLCNKGSGLKSEKPLPVYLTNQLGQILPEAEKRVGINPDCNTLQFENGRLGTSTSDKQMTVAEFGLEDGDVLYFVEDGKVAAA